MKGIILHGGNGTRLRPLTYSDVKQLLPIAGKPISEYALENLIEIGITDINIIVGSVGGEDVRNYYGNGSKWKVNISYTYQDKPLGIAHAIGLCREFVGNDRFVVYLGDNYLQNGIAEMSKHFSQSDTLLALTTVSNPSQFGIAEVKDDKITKLVEKPKIPKSNLAITGVYFFDSSIFESIDKLQPSERGEYEITEALQDQIDRGKKVTFSVVKGWFKDTGTVKDFLECNRLILDSIPEHELPPSLTNLASGRLTIPEDLKVSSDSKILGPCYIGKGTVIENSYIGPFTSIGSNCIIKNAEITDSVIMDGACIDFSSRYHIRESLVGPNAIAKTSSNSSKTLKIVIGRDSKLEVD